MKISQKDAKLLIIMACVVLLGVSYFFGYSKYNDMTDEMNTKTQALLTQYEKLEEKNKHRDEYTKKIQENKDKIASITAKYPSKIQNKDEIYLSSIIEKQCGAWVNTVNISDIAIVYTPQNTDTTGTDTAETTTDSTKTESNKAPATTDTTTDAAINENGLKFIGYKATTQLSFQADYDQMKKIVAFINNYSSRKSISAITLAVDNTTGLLTGTLDYNSYCLVGADTTYTPLEIPKLPTGVKNIFDDMVRNNETE